MFFVVSEGGRSIKNQSKSNIKSILNEEAKTTPKNSPDSAQHDPKIDPGWTPCWASKPSRTRPGGTKTDPRIGTQTKANFSRFLDPGARAAY